MATSTARLRLDARFSGRGDTWLSEQRVRRNLPPSPGDQRTIADQIMRRGPGSVQEQRRRESFATATGGSIAWLRGRDFGSRRASSRTLNRSGRLDSSWLGSGPDSITRTTSRSIEVGVSGYGALYQRERSWRVRANPRNRTARGNLAMRMVLGLGFDAWVSEATLLGRGLLNHPRRVGISRAMLGRVGTSLLRLATTTGELRVS